MQEKLTPPQKQNLTKKTRNETLWNEYKVKKPTIFVIYRFNDVFELIEAGTDQSQMKL